jgi:hypothetical protein
VDQAVKTLEGGANFDAAVKVLGVTAAPAAFVGRNDPQIPAQVREAAFAAPHPGDKPIYRALALDNGGAALLSLSSVKPGTAGANPKNDEELATQFKNRDRDGDITAYMAQLEKGAVVKRNPTIFQ